MARSKKSLKKIQSLVFLLLITLIMGLTATYAWFSTQRDVEITGMRINVEVAESMQISLDGEKWTQSINIADMKQFYGTYNSNGTEGFAIYQAKSGDNLNYVPTELLPVSTAGEVSGGKLQFVKGTVTNNSDGTQSLTGITKCTETDIVSNATVSSKEENNKFHPYLVFDMYLRNISAKESGIDDLKLNEDSRVYINTSWDDNLEQEGKGKSGTGLEYSARVGMIVYGNTVSVTAKDDATLGTVAEQVRGITHTNSEVAAIWEPNHKEHTQYVVDNNGRGITSLSQEVTTYGIKTAVADIATPNNKVININAATDANSDGIEDTNANLVAVKTFTPQYSLAGTTIGTNTITDTAGNAIGLAPNQISKVRIYIWLEGQDPDCIDLASTGDKLNINLKLIKDANTINDNTYDGEYTAGGGSGAGSGNTENYITADTLTTADYGGYVTNYTPTNGVNDEGIKWRIFYGDTIDDNIYLIADSYVPLTNEAGTKNYIPTGYTNTSGRYAFNIMAYLNYNGTADIDSNIASKWLSKYTAAGYTATNTYENGKATAYLLDTNAWSGFKDSTYADYAVGAPTIELFAASYNVTHTDKTIETQVDEYGYDIAWSDTGFDPNYWNGYIDGLNTSESLYGLGDMFSSMWIGAPACTGSMYCVYAYYGSLSYEAVGDFIDGYACNCSRPIICLNSSVKLEKQEDGTYLLVQ